MIVLIMIVLIPYINLLHLSWIRKCLFLRNMEPLRGKGNNFDYGYFLPQFSKWQFQLDKSTVREPDYLITVDVKLTVLAVFYISV